MKAGKVVLTAVALLPCASYPLATAAPAPTGPPASTVPSPTPLLSVRRMPDWIEEAVAAAKAAASLPSLLRPLGPAATTSCLVATQGGRTLVAVGATRPVLPASNEKLLTASVALDRLGAGYRYTTTVRATSRPVRGTVHGDLYLVGGGDPVLRTPQYEATLPDAVPPWTSLPALAARVRAAGVTTVTGTVVGDGSRYDARRAVPGWKAEYTADGDAGPLSGLDVDDGFHITPAGYTADADPDQQAAATFAQLLVADGVRIGAVAAPPPGTPAPAAAAALTAAEAAAGAAAAAGTTPATAPEVAAEQSAPLAEVLGAILEPSDDTAAEEVVKEIGRAAGTGGSTASGTAAMRADLASRGLPVSGSVIDDGSGLDTSDRVSCGLVAGILGRAVAEHSPLVGDLAVAGHSGTLAHRLASPPTGGRVLAKTGTLDGVSALSGVVLPPSHGASPVLQLRTPVVFSLIMNGVTGDEGITTGDSVAAALARYPTTVPLNAVSPKTVGPVG